MFIKKALTLLLVSAALLAPSVSAGGVRGVFTTENEIEGSRPMRNLKEDKNAFVPAPVAPVPIAPTLPPAPVPPPTPTGAALFVSQCRSSSFDTCVGATFASYDACTTCIYAQLQLKTVSDSGVIACGKFLCGNCVEEAKAMYECGKADSTPVPPPISPPVSPPVIDLVSPVQVAPVPTAPVPVAPIPTAVVVPVAVPVAPPPTGSDVCAASLPKSGDSCTTGGAPWVYCCYNVNIIDLTLVCSCLNGDDKYVCNLQGSTSSCSTIIDPLGGAPDILPPPTPPPVPEPTPPPFPPPTAPTVPEPTEAPVEEPVAPTDSPVPDPTEAPVAPPVVIIPTEAPIVEPEPPVPSNPNIPEFCQGPVPQDGTSCEGVLPEGLSSGVCGGEIIEVDELGMPVSVTTATCMCSADNPVWMCTATVVTAPPVEAPVSPNTCPITEKPNTGDPCGKLLALIDYQMCLFVQPETGALVSCECDGRGISNKADAVWVCGGTFPPALAPTLMPAGETQPISLQPVPTVPTIPEIAECPPAETPPSTGDSCEGFLPAGLSNATCNFENRIKVGDTTTVTQTACNCRASTGVWNCSGGEPATVVLTLQTP